MACIRRYNEPVYSMYTELWVYGLYNDQYTYVSLYNCILACVDYRTQSVMRPYMYLLSQLQTPLIS